MGKAKVSALKFLISDSSNIIFQKNLPPIFEQFFRYYFILSECYNFNNASFRIKVAAEPNGNNKPLGNPVFAPFVKMVTVGVPVGAVVLKMKEQGIEDHQINFFEKCYETQF